MQPGLKIWIDLAEIMQKGYRCPDLPSTEFFCPRRCQTSHQGEVT
jgi:hypothetical protein